MSPILKLRSLPLALLIYTSAKVFEGTFISEACYRKEPGYYLE
jgi:hypothetical protein